LRNAAAADFEVYGGVGVRVFDLPASSNSDYASTVEGGVDEILAGLGVGLRIDTPRWNPAVALQLRYSLLDRANVRVLAGVGAGVERLSDASGASYDWDNTYEFFAAARFKLGLPYLGVCLGGAKSRFGRGSFQMSTTLTAGLAF